MKLRVARGMRRRRGRGFTLVELVLTCAVLSILLLGLSAAMLVAIRAVESAAAGPAARTLQASDILSQLAADLSVAQGFTERTDTAVTFTVPDRDGVNGAETIRYALSNGTLTRTYNGTSVTVATGVQHFRLTYLTTTLP